MGVNLKVVLDTNILVSAILFQGKPGKILELVLDKQIVAITSKILLSELQETLVKKFNFSEEKIKQIDHKITKSFILVYPTEQISVQKDADNNRVLEAAVEGKCSFIVTGDKELLELGLYKSVKILTADQFLKILEQV